MPDPVKNQPSQDKLQIQALLERVAELEAAERRRQEMQAALDNGDDMAAQDDIEAAQAMGVDPGIPPEFREAAQQARAAEELAALRARSEEQLAQGLPPSEDAMLTLMRAQPGEPIPAVDLTPDPANPAADSVAMIRNIREREGLQPLNPAGSVTLGEGGGMVEDNRPAHVDMARRDVSQQPVRSASGRSGGTATMQGDAAVGYTPPEGTRARREGSGIRLEEESAVDRLIRLGRSLF